MPLYPEQLVAELEAHADEFEGNVLDDPEIAAKYREAATELHENRSVDDIEDELRDEQFPGALPTSEYDEEDSLVVPFTNSSDWQSHEAVNDWARDSLSGVSTVAADGSQIDPITDFNIPVGLAQVVWLTNHHTDSGSYQEDVALDLLSAAELIDEGSSGRLRIDDQEVPTRRFELEVEILEERIRDLQDKDPPPVIIYDGPLILSFIEIFPPSNQDRYLEAMGKLLAASRHYRVPIIGYVAGSKATELFEMLRRLGVVETRSSQAVRDFRILELLMTNWGDRSVLFRSHRDETIRQLQTVYGGRQYTFGDRILFTYLNVGEGAGLDRLELPRWIHEEDLTTHVMNTIRAECGVGRGYPEILQQVDADAVIDSTDRDRFLRLFQKFAESNGIELEWDSKTLSKKRRRR